MTNTVPTTVRVPDDDADSTDSFKDDPNGISFRYHPDLLDASWGSYLHSAAGDRNVSPATRKVVINVPEGAESQQVFRVLPKTPKGILRTTEAKEEHPARKQKLQENEEPRPLTKELRALEAALKTARDESGVLGMEEEVIDMLSNACELLVKAREDRGSAAGEDTENGAGSPRSALQMVAACLEKLVKGLVDSYKRMKAQEDRLEGLEEELCRKQVQFLKEQEDMELSVKNKLAGSVAGESQPRPHASAPVPKVPRNLPKVHIIPSIPTRTVPYTSAHGKHITHRTCLIS